MSLEPVSCTCGVGYGRPEPHCLSKVNSPYLPVVQPTQTRGENGGHQQKPGVNQIYVHRPLADVPLS
jgi:hypothetical protein